jgi:putative aldouronate transport system substrate-binding protein
MEWKTMRIVAATLTLLLFSAPVAFSTGQQEGTATSGGVKVGAGPLGKYEPAITIDMPFRDQNREYPPGQSPTDNVWLWGIEEELGIKINYVWEVKNADYHTKLNTVIASGDLPDVFQANDDTYYRLAKGGQIADITDAFDRYLHPGWESFLTDKWRQMSYVNGRLYGIGWYHAPEPLFLYYRDDWAEAVGITEEPETLQDVIDMAYAFKSGDPNGDGTRTVGIGANRNVFGGSPGSFEPIFNAYDAWPTIWIERDGELVYGGTNRNNVDALRVLQDAYRDGVIDGEFALKNPWVELANDISGNRIGMLTCKYWLTGWNCVQVVMQNNPWEATWTAVDMPHSEGGIIEPSIATRLGSLLVANAKFEYPEAIVKLLNFSYDKIRLGSENLDARYHSLIQDGERYDMFFLNPIFGTQAVGMKNEEIPKARMINRALNGELDPESLPLELPEYYEEIKEYLGEEDFSGFTAYQLWYEPVSTILMQEKYHEPGAVVFDEYFGPNTPTMNRNWGNIKSKQVELFSKIIMGDPVEETFDEWLQYFNDQGGREITEEVNDWYEDNR